LNWREKIKAFRLGCREWLSEILRNRALLQIL
jgi:hypothetical protein